MVQEHVRLFTIGPRVVVYVTFIEQKGECIIRYFGRPCDEFAEYLMVHE